MKISCLKHAKTYSQEIFRNEILPILANIFTILLSGKNIEDYPEAKRSMREFPERGEIVKEIIRSTAKRTSSLLQIIKTQGIENLNKAKDKCLDRLISLHNTRIIGVREEEEFKMWLEMYLYVENERWQRKQQANNFHDETTHFAGSLPYIILKEAALQKDEAAQEDSLTIIQDNAEVTTRDFYHPDDGEGTQYSNKFFTKEPTKAKELFDELLTKNLHDQLSKYGPEELVEKQFELNKTLAYLPHAFKRDLQDIMKTHPGDNPKEISIMYTEQPDFEDAPTEIPLSNEMAEYFIRNPEKEIMALEGREQICSELRTWAGKQPKQAHLTHEVVEYMIRAVTEPAADREEVFEVTKIAEAINSRRKTNKKTTKKEVRSVLNKIKEDLPFLEFHSD